VTHVSILVCAFGNVVRAQAIRVVATPNHVVNKFSPPYAFSTTVGRVPSNATDTFFAPDQLKQTLEAGWGVVSYRQNTELFVEAWHWNPASTRTPSTATGQVFRLCHSSKSVGFRIPSSIAGLMFYFVKFSICGNRANLPQNFKAHPPILALC
jgi:hypothetical protein